MQMVGGHKNDIYDASQHSVITHVSLDENI